MNLLDKFLPRTEFSGYEDFKQNYEVVVPDNFNFGYDVVDEYARVAPEKLALHWYSEDHGERLYTFAELKRLSDKAANAFLALGITKGDRVMLILKQRPQVWICLTALCKIGAVAIPATFQLTKKDIVYRCNSASVRMICAVSDHPGLTDYILEARGECETLEEVALVGPSDTIPEGCLDLETLIDSGEDRLERRYNNNSDFMLIYFSSGTTGMPKMIAHDFTYPLGHIVTAKYWQHVEDDGGHLTVSDSGWAKFAWGKIFGQWISGATIVAYDNEKFEPAKLLAAIKHLKPVTFCAPPTIYRFLIKEHLSREDFASVHHCAIAGEPLSPEVFNRFYELTGLKVHEGFGQSETSVIIGNFGWDPIKPGSTGKPSPLYDLDIVDENGESCEDGIVGSIVVKNTDKKHPVGLFRCYYNDDDAMERSWKDGVYNTGDMAWRDSDGYFWFEGRSDDVIKCSGYRIGPFEVESALLTHPSVLECAVTAAPDPVRGQVVKATVVLAKGYSPSDELRRELQNHVKHTTAPYKYPRILEFVEELPKTVGGGKIKRGEIRNQDMAAANAKK